jgi:hypothetical protein
MHIHETKVRESAPLLFYGICELQWLLASLNGICNAAPNCSEIFKFSIRAFAANTL